MFYAVGDVHGSYDKLIVAVAMIKAHAGIKPYEVFFLGDYVDRGHRSRECVNLIRGLCNSSQGDKGQGKGTFGRWYAIKGNHETMMAQFLAGQDSMDMWKMNGGEETIASYPNKAEMQSHSHWLNSLPSHIEREHYYFVHAGCSPRYALGEQPEEVELWIRGWDRDDHDFGKHIVYGHTPNLKGVVKRANSTGLDTGAVYGGALSVGVFDPKVKGGPLEILEAK